MKKSKDDPMSLLFVLEKRKLSHIDYPLWERILQGPSDDIMKIFLMDMHEEEVSIDVSYIYGQWVFNVDLTLNKTCFMIDCNPLFSY